MQATKVSSVKPLRSRYSVTRLHLEKRNAELVAAIKKVLRHISTHQVYDKDAKGILTKALDSAINK